MNLICFWVLEIPLAWVLSHTIGMGPNGVFLAAVIAWSTLAVLAAAVFRMGRWKRVIV
jgi:Na+-driven multidrug efflux pump